jgi:hypothetical protein
MKPKKTEMSWEGSITDSVVTGERFDGCCGVYKSVMERPATWRQFKAFF